MSSVSIADSEYHVSNVYSQDKAKIYQITVYCPHNSSNQLGVALTEKNIGTISGLLCVPAALNFRSWKARLTII